MNQSTVDPGHTWDSDMNRNKKKMRNRNTRNECINTWFPEGLEFFLVTFSNFLVTFSSF